MNEDTILYFVILITLIYFYQKRTSIGFLKFLNEKAKEKKIDNPVDYDLNIDKNLDEDVKGYKEDSKVLGWIIVIYLIYGLLELLLV
tara:strand:+ start:185 stop:445 length:261 start_codon:yes stop_codon:yes gene_type:complete